MIVEPKTKFGSPPMIATGNERNSSPTQHSAASTIAGPSANALARGSANEKAEMRRSMVLAASSTAMSRGITASSSRWSFSSGLRSDAMVGGELVTGAVFCPRTAARCPPPSSLAMGTGVHGGGGSSRTWSTRSEYPLRTHAASSHHGSTGPEISKQSPHAIPQSAMPEVNGRFSISRTHAGGWRSAPRSLRTRTAAPCTRSGGTCTRLARASPDAPKAASKLGFCR